MKKKIKILVNTFAVIALIMCTSVASIDANNRGMEKRIIRVYKLDIKNQITKRTLRNTRKAFNEAEGLKADYIIIHLNIYSGKYNIADSIRAQIMNSEIPVFVFIDNMALSAGALIAIACDSIYIRNGGAIGAATVINQAGEIVNEKYRSIINKTMRATAESHGKDTIILNNDTIIKWYRDPEIAEAMVNPDIEIKSVIESGRVLTLTTMEALEIGYCEGIAVNIHDVLRLAGIKDYNIIISQFSIKDSFPPIISSLLILLIFIYILRIPMWIIFNKAGKPGWSVLIPFFGEIVLMKIIGKPWWWIFLWAIPFIGLIWHIWSFNMLSKSFGKNVGFTLGIIFVPYIFILILAFGKAKYLGPAGRSKLSGI